MKIILCSFLLFALTSLASASSPRLFEFSLDGSAALPPNGSIAAARGTVVISDAETAVTISLRVEGLSAAQTSASIVRDSGAVISLPTSDFSTTIELTPAEISGLRAGEWRVVIATGAFPAGEIAGRVEPHLPAATFGFPASNGSLDATFGSGGIVSTDRRGGINVAQAVGVQPDGKILVAGFDRAASNDFAVARYNPDGTLDSGFGDNGYVITSNVSGDDEGIAIALYPDGRFVVAGQVWEGAVSDLAAVRYLSNGTPDPTFGTGGFVRTSVFAGSDQVKSVAVQPDGKIVVAGQAFNGANNDIAVVRYNIDGSLDETFDGPAGNGNGIVTAAIGPGNDFAYGVALQTDGRIVIAGYYFSGTTNDALILRLNSDGTFDTTFDGDGIVTASAGAATDEAFALAIQPDGKIVFAGCTNNAAPNDFLIGRLNSDGSRDAGFGADGLTVTPIGAGAEFANAIAVQPDGKIVAAGFSNNGSNNDFAVVRKNADGSPDLSFDFDGKLTTALGASVDSANGVAIQADGKIVAVGRTIGQTADFGIVRYGYGTNSATNDGFVDTGSLADVRFSNAFRRGSVAAGGVNSVGLPPLSGGGRHLVSPRSFSTDAGYGGFVDYKISLPLRVGAAEFAAAKILNLENGVWVDRTSALPARDFATRTIFARVTNLSVIAVVSTSAPQTAFGDLTGRVFRYGQKPADALLAVSEPGGQPFDSRTNQFGYFRVRNLAFRQTYLLRIRSKNLAFRSILLSFDDDEPAIFQLSP